MAKKHRSPAKFLSVLISLLIMLLSMPAMASAAAPPAPGTISVSKTAQPFDTYQITDPFDAATIQPNHRKTLVTLNVGAVPLASQVDLIMTFDVSFSMNNDSLNAMKTAAKSMAASIIGANAGSRVAIVRYATRAYGYDFSAAGWDGISELDTTHGYFSSDLTAINTAIDSLVIATGDSGGTNSEGGFLTADWIMQNQGRADAGFVPSGKRAIVFMSDGVPTYRYDSEYVPLNGWSGSESSYRELNEAMEAGAAAGKNGTETNFIYTIGLVSGLDDYSKGVARLFLNNQARVNTDWEWGEPLDAQTTADPSLQFESGYYEAADATTISAFYAAIPRESTRVATNGVVTDIIAPEWTLDLSSILVDGAAPAPGVVTVVGQTLTWNLGAISSTSRSLSYVISGNAPYYGIADTNDSAQLTFTHVLASPPVSSPILFPVPEAMLPAFTADDEQTTAWDTPISFDVRDNDTVLNTKVDESESYVPDFDDFYPIFDTPVFSDGTDHGDLVQAVDGSFTYTPDGSGITVGYDVTFRYYLVGIDSMLKSEPSTAVIHVTPVPDDGVLTIYKYVYDAEGFDISDSGLSFPIRVTGPSYPAGFETSIVSGTPLVLGSLKYGDYLVEELLDDSSPYVSDIPAEGLSANLNVENKYVYMYIYNTQIPAPDLAVVKVAENLTD
ncbi:MAG: VWA domain-containing protein, partial [Clostridia bacterium]|nr:VWA domain-containing protein [Clostridia bacterium]